MKKQNKSIMYVNYSPYENSGKILDFLLEEFSLVVLFSLGFHSLVNKKRYNILIVYKNGKKVKEYKLFQIPLPKRLIFLLLPLQSLITFFEIFFYSLILRKNFGKFDVYFSVNAFTVWIGNILKQLGFVKKTVFWVWDYYPPKHKSIIITIMRWIYWQFDKASTKSDRVVFINRRIMDLRKDIGIIPENSSYPIVPIGTDTVTTFKKRTMKPLKLGFIGVLKESQGFGLIFDHAQEIIKRFPDAQYEIIGSGPDEEHFKEMAKKSTIQTKFYGYLEGDSFNDVLTKCHIGIATYLPTESNVSIYGDPGKIKRYLTLGIPVIATNVFEFAETIKKEKAGVIIDYYDSTALLEAMAQIMSDYEQYTAHALKLAAKFYYQKIYPEIFALD